jgi:hypothetical protein
MSEPTDASTAALVEVPPHEMAPVLRGALTTTAQVQVAWQALTGAATGGANVDSYLLEWDAGSAGAGWDSLQGGPAAPDYSLATTHTVSAGIVPGASYRFRVSAHNAQGWGPASAETTVVAATSPGTPDAPVTSVENIYVKIAWTPPASNSAAIDGYDVYI